MRNDVWTETRWLLGALRLILDEPFGCVPDGTGVPNTVDCCDATYLRSNHRSAQSARHVTLATPETFPFLECAPGSRITSAGNS